MGAYGQIIQELREDAKAFLVMEFVHERREANHDAHVLARSILSSFIGQHCMVLLIHQMVFVPLILLLSKSDEPR